MKATTLSVKLDELYSEAQKILSSACEDGLLLTSYKPGREEEAEELVYDICEKLEDIRDMIDEIQFAVEDDFIEL